MKTLTLALLAFLFLVTTVSADGFPPALASTLPSTMPTAIHVPANSGDATSPLNNIGGAVKTQAQKLKVNINTASTADIAKLPGIGPKKADAIVQGRPYNTAADIMKVKGIKQGVYNKIKNMISVN